MASDQLLEEALDAITETFRVAARNGSAHEALEWLADWANSRDIVQPDDEATYRTYLDKAARRCSDELVDVGPDMTGTGFAYPVTLPEWSAGQPTCEHQPWHHVDGGCLHCDCPVSSQPNNCGPRGDGET